jgi:hypothetical protein
MGYTAALGLIMLFIISVLAQSIMRMMMRTKESQQ